ncbi:MarR family transcriptional regulator [Pseudomonas sp. D1-3]
MTMKIEPGLGELLRYVSELVERGAEQHYQEMGLTYRARYTPVLRAIEAGARTITEITARTHLTQGAISQTVNQMEADGLITRQRGADARKSEVHLAPAGQRLMPLLIGHWAATFHAIEQLEQDIGHPLRQVLRAAAQALQHQDFSQRLSAAKRPPAAGVPGNE